MDDGKSLLLSLHFQPNSEKFNWIAEVFDACCKHYCLTIETMRGHSVTFRPVRPVVAFLLHHNAHLEPKEIASIMNRDRSIISRWLSDIDLAAVHQDIFAIQAMYNSL